MAGFVRVGAKTKWFCVLGRGEGGRERGKEGERQHPGNRPGVAIQMMTSLKFDLPLEVNDEARSALC